jgi:CheY-like chemotaxis protein
LHRGRISAQSGGRDHGATFRVELPLFKPAVKNNAKPAPRKGAGEPKPGTTVETGAGSKGADKGAVRVRPVTKQTDGMMGRILLVEDHAATRTALEHLLVRRKYEVRSAASATEARALAQQESFDLLISDIGLPDGNGYDLMREFREQYGMTGISLTGYGMEEDVSRSRDAGFVQHLTKPVRMQSLDSALASISRA